MKQILSIVGARPQFVKLFPIQRAISQYTNFKHSILHTGQHFDKEMSENIFRELDIPSPQLNLGAGGGTNTYQTAQILLKLEESCLKQVPDLILVYGDTNSSLAASIFSSQKDIPFAHVESGLRSGNLRMAEEQNRIVVDHLADILFAPTKNAMSLLEKEGLSSRAFLSGDIMRDAFDIAKQEISSQQNKSNWNGIPTKESYYLATIHRAENTDSKSRLSEILEVLAKLDRNVIVPIHPRLRKSLETFNLNLNFDMITFIPPLSYMQNLRYLMNAKAVVTDSGGLQKEAYFAEIPCFTIRLNTEWPETLLNNCNTLVTNLQDLPDQIVDERTRLFTETLFGEGNSAFRMLSHLEDYLK